MSDTCGCCEAPVSPTPECIENRPGLSAIAYRVGSYASFRQAMVEAIAGKAELGRWTARTSDDYGIAILEMWAYLADILTFYQERIANEAFLGTAVFRESVLRLAALLDYQPTSGMAATSYLAFTVEDGKTVEITPGMRVQSVPGQDEKAQKFETVETLTAKAELNEFRIYPCPQADTPLAQGYTAATALGDISHLFPDDKIVIFQPTLLVISDQDQKQLLQKVEALDAAGKQQVLAQELEAALLASADLEWGGGGTVEWAEAAHQETVAGYREDLYQQVGAAKEIENPIQKALQLLLAAQACDKKLIHVEDKKVEDIQEVDWRQAISWTPAIRCSFATGAELYKWTNKFRLFGHNAPSEFFSVSVDEKKNVSWSQETYDPYLSDTSSLKLDALYDELKENTELLLVAQLSGGAVVQRISVVGTEQVSAEVAASAGAAPAMQATVTRIMVTPSVPAGIDVRTAVLYELEGPAIILWQQKYGVGISGNKVHLPLVELDLEEDEDALALMEAGRRIMVEDKDGHEQATTVVKCELVEDHLQVELDDALSTGLDAATAVGRANVVLATHGETIADEVLGSGDASSARQAFSVKKSPVTFVPKSAVQNGTANRPTSGGAVNTLEVRVEGVLWHEKDYLYGRDSDERIYITRVDNDGVMTVQFGDGETGARLPTGKKNVVATYRQGIGQDGNVDADTISNALDKPVGLKAVINPTAASGGAEPESLDQARTNAPNTVRTFDRIVSLQDFEDAARAYAGVAKARADWQWVDEEQVVQLTVAGDEGAEIEVGGQTHSNLVADLDGRRDPNRKMVVGSYTPVPLEVEAAIQVDTDYEDKDVQAAALAALVDYFDFDNLDLGQPIHLSDIYRVLQEVDGMVAVDVNRLQFKKVSDRSRHGASAEPVQAHLVIWVTELATVEDSTLDLVVKVGLS